MSMCNGEKKNKAALTKSVNLKYLNLLHLFT